MAPDLEQLLSGRDYSGAIALLQLQHLACNSFKLYGGPVAESNLNDMKETTETFDHDLLQHNLVVFRHGVGASEVLPKMLDVFPEACLNLAIFHMHNNDMQAAYEAMNRTEAITPLEYAVKAVACVNLGQQISSEEFIQQSLQYFQLVGSSTSNCDTILGRQCMASFFIITKQFDDALVYLESIKSFCENLDEFNWNYAISKASVGEYHEAEKSFLRVCNVRYVDDYYYQVWLSHCFIMNKKADIAWERYLHMETSDESFRFALHQLI